MSKPDNLDSLHKISSTVSERDKKIWENEAHIICIRKETEKLRDECVRLKKATEQMEKGDKVLEVQLDELTKTLSIQQQTLHTSEQSVLAQSSFLESLLQEAEDWKKKYSAVLELYEEEYQEHRSMYVKGSKSYQELQALRVKVKKLEIQEMDLRVKIENEKRSRKQFNDIQKRRLQATIIKFAEFYTLYHKAERSRLEVEELKKEEQQLLKEHLELVEKVKVMQRKRVAKNRTQVENAAPAEPSGPSKENKKLSSDKLQRFMSEEIKPVSLTSIDSTTQLPNFSEDNTKVRILDIKIMKPPTPKPIASKKPNLDLRKKMENIIETTRKNALRSNSFQITPPSSQKSQETKENSSGVSQTMSALYLAEKPSAAPQKSSILKPLDQNIPPASDSLKQENISKFFNPKNKKTVTFQGDERSQFQFFTGSEKRQIKTEGVPCNLDIFRKPFSFKAEPASKQDVNNQSFMRSSNFGGLFHSSPGDTIKGGATPTSEVEATGSTNTSGFILDSGLTYSNYVSDYDEKTPEGLRPFEASFEIPDRSFARSSPPQTSDVAQPSNNNTFSLFGSQNNNNNFNMF